MATTAQPYGQFLVQMPQTGIQIAMHDLFICLLKNTYTPNLSTHQQYAEVAAYELPNDATAGGYTTGGATLSKTWGDYEPTSRTVSLTADPVTWTKLTGTVRYAVIYAQDGDMLVGLIDFGEDKTFAAEQLTLTFTTGVMILAAA